MKTTTSRFVGSTQKVVLAAPPQLYSPSKAGVALREASTTTAPPRPKLSIPAQSPNRQPGQLSELIGSELIRRYLPDSLT